MKFRNRIHCSTLLKEFIQDLSGKYLPVNADLKINIVFERHLPDRILDRKISKDVIERILTGLIRDRMAETLFLSQLEGNASGKLNLLDEKSNTLLCFSINCTNLGVYYINLRTIFEINTSKKDPLRLIKILDKTKEEQIMKEIPNTKYHSTGQFRNVVKSIKQQAQFKGMGGNGEAIMDRTAIAPTLTYIGTVKLHGTNGSIIKHEDGMVSFHSKSKMLGYILDEEFTLLSDNAEFAQTMFRRYEAVSTILETSEKMSEELYGEVKYPIKVSGEFAGQGIQKGVGISYLPAKSFFIFGLKLGDTNQQEKTGWVSPILLKDLSSPEQHIYSIANFDYKKVDINFNEPEYVQNTLVEHTLQCEENCPVSEKLGITESTLGEGYVWTPLDPDYIWDSGNWFKTKGKKHSVSKTKSVAAICPEKLNSIKEFVEYSVTDNRLQQGLGEVGLDKKLIGNFLGWINKDINKEEGDVLEANNLSMKDVGKMVSAKSREFYLKELNKF